MSATNEAFWQDELRETYSKRAIYEQIARDETSKERVLELSFCAHSPPTFHRRSTRSFSVDAPAQSTRSAL